MSKYLTKNIKIDNKILVLTAIAYDGHIPVNFSEIVKNIFKYGMDPELGEYYYIMKNSWASHWLINGGGVLPVNIHPYIAFLFFELVEAAEAAPLQATIFRKTVVCLPDESDNASSAFTLASNTAASSISAALTAVSARIVTK